MMFLEIFVECFLYTLHVRNEMCMSVVKVTCENIFPHLQFIAQDPTSNVKQLSYGREAARSLRRFRLTSIVIREIMHKISFLGHPMCISGAMKVGNSTVLTQRNFVAEFH